MRQMLYNEFKPIFRNELLRNRQSQMLTQRQMAELLEMSERAYAELESGRSSCNVPTLLMFSVTCGETSQAVFEQISDTFQQLLMSESSTMNTAAQLEMKKKQYIANTLSNIIESR